MNIHDQWVLCDVMSSHEIWLNSILEIRPHNEIHWKVQIELDKRYQLRPYSAKINPRVGEKVLIFLKFNMVVSVHQLVRLVLIWPGFWNFSFLLITFYLQFSCDLPFENYFRAPLIVPILSRLWLTEKRYHNLWK